jgi:hypothetical protein
MDDLNRIGVGYAIKNLISIASDRLHAKRRIGRLRSAERVPRDLRDSLMKRSEYVVRPGRAARFKVSMDFVEIS